MCPENSFRVAPFIALYSLTHLAVDAACAFLLLGVLELKDHVILSMLLYNAIAFVLQAPFGYLMDKALNPRLAAILGLAFVAVSFLCWNIIFAALIMVGIGNALFHVGGGSLVLSLKNRKATFSGIYVAPGGIGLALGSFLAVSLIDVNPMVFPWVLVMLGLILYFVKTPEFNRAKEPKYTSNYGMLIIACILFPIAVRSLIGLSIEFPWKENVSLYVVLIVALALGKVFGGMLTDRYGLIKVGVGGLLLAMPFLSFFPSIPALGILGAFLFNFTMPVTLIAIWSMMPGNKGLSFGLTTAALFIGSIPVIMGKNAWMKNDLVVFSLILTALVILLVALRLMDRLKQERRKNEL